MVLLLFLSFVILIFLGMPVAFSLGVSSVLYLFLNDIPLIVAAQKMYAGIDSFVLVCIPGFILAGNLMNTGGITKRIIRFSNAAVGWITGGLGLANVAASMLFAGISGTALADTASLGAILIPGMKEEGYDADFSAAITASSSTIGPIIPPSLPMIVAGTLVGLSVSKLFVAGVIPGVLLGFGLMGMGYFIAKKRKYPKGQIQPVRVVFKAFMDAVWAVLMTIIILFGILGGFFTPTEASCVAVIYALIIAGLVYRTLDFKAFIKCVFDSAITSANTLLIIGTSTLFTYVMVKEGISAQLADFILGINSNPRIVVFTINIILLLLGMFMEPGAILTLMLPVLLPIAQRLQFDLVYFGVVVVLNLMIGQVTPPFGVCLFITSDIAKIRLERLYKAIVPFLIPLVFVLFLCIYCEPLITWLPNLVLGE